MSEKLIASSVADALEAEYLAVANGQKKPGKLDLQTLVRAVQCIRELERASQPGSGEDTARLDFLIDEGAVVDAITTANGEKRYQLTWPDLGESQNAWYSSARIAIDTMIDAARASLDGRS